MVLPGCSSEVTDSTGKESQCSYLPTCWDDDVRMKALFSAFRKKELNPTGWHEKMDFWIHAIGEYCKMMKRAVISAEDIRLAFERDKRYPNCIDDVLDHMNKQGAIMNVEEFSHVDASDWLGWGYDLVVRKPLAWGYATMKGIIFQQQPNDVKYVVLDVIKDIAAAILTKHARLLDLEKVDYIVEFDEFRLQCNDICRKEDFALALIILQQDKKAVLLRENGKQYVKFKKDENDDISCISENDRAIIKLRNSLQLLEHEIDAAEKEVNLCTSEAKSLIQQGQKSKAMALLRKRKKLENELNRKTASVYNLETLLIQLKNTSSSKQVLQAYNAGVAAMKTTFANDLCLDKVDTIMADLEDAADNMAEVQNTLAKGFSVSGDDMCELEQELDDILSHDNKDVPCANTSLEQREEELMRRFESLRVPVGDISISPVPEVQAASRISAGSANEQQKQNVLA